MINNISEGPLRIASKIDPTSVIHDKEVRQQKEKEVSEARAVESSEAGEGAQQKQAKEDQGTSRFIHDDHTMVFEKYDKNGALVLRIPPSSNPVDEKA